MRVAFVSVGDPEDVNVWSGIPHSILGELREQADSVEIVALDRNFRYLYAPAKLWHAFRKTQMQLDRHPFALRQYRRQIEQQLRGKSIDVILATSSIPVTGLRAECPILFWTDAVVDAMAEYYPAAFTGLSKQELQLCHDQEKQALQNSADVLYSSAWAVDTVRQHYPDVSTDLHVVEFGANLSIDMTAGEPERLIEARLQRQSLDLLWVGVDWVRKGGDIALNATRLLRQRGLPALLHVVGCTAPASEFVQNHGFLNRASAPEREALIRLFQDSAFFLFPTRAEAAGIVFSEASCFALPMIATGTGGVGTYVLPERSGVLLQPEAPAVAYADVIERLWKDAAHYRRLSLGARREFVERLNWRTSVGKALRLASGQ